MVRHTPLLKNRLERPNTDLNLMCSLNDPRVRKGSVMLCMNTLTFPFCPPSYSKLLSPVQSFKTFKSQNKKSSSSFANPHLVTKLWFVADRSNTFALKSRKFEASFVSPNLQLKWVWDTRIDASLQISWIWIILWWVCPNYSWYSCLGQENKDLLIYSLYYSTSITTTGKAMIKCVLASQNI